MSDAYSLEVYSQSPTTPPKPRDKNGKFKSKRVFQLEDELYNVSQLSGQRASEIGKLSNRINGLQAEVADAKKKLRAATRPKKLSNMRKRLKGMALSTYPARIVPEELAQTAVEIIEDDTMASTLETLMERYGDFSTDEALLLAGIGINRQARDHFDAALDAMWAKNVLTTDRNAPNYNLKPRDVVIGGGLHAAIFASVRHKLSGQKPVVIDNGVRVGGSFAVSRNPSFFLNSRNRPGDLGVPGSGDALNVIPEGPLQPFDLGGGEFQSNDVMAWAIRVALMKSAEVYPSVEAYDPSGVNPAFFYYDREPNRPNFKYCRRIIMATGLGKPQSAVVVNDVRWPFDDRHISFADLMRRMDDPFPFRGMKRVAVIGAGDSGKTAIETLTGQGPYHATAFIDRPETIDWYGVPTTQRKPADWVACNRGRYRRIGSLLNKVVKPLDNVSRVRAVYGGYQVQGRIYDYVIDCTGAVPSAPPSTFVPMVRGAQVGKVAGNVFYVGPAAALPASPNDTDIFRGIPENATSIFRLAPKTALFAESL